jgi:hypothetical protein
MRPDITNSLVRRLAMRIMIIGDFANPKELSVALHILANSAIKMFDYQPADVTITPGPVRLCMRTDDNPALPFQELLKDLEAAAR